MATEKKSISHFNKAQNFNSTERLFDLIHAGENESTIEELLQEGIDIHAKDSNGFSPLLLATKLRRKNIVELLIKYKGNADGDEFDQTALHCAAMFGHLEIVKCLVERGANINATVYSGATPLFYAAGMGHRDVVNLLLYFGANVDIRDKYMTTVLHFAALNGWTEVVQSVVMKRVLDIDVKDDEGNTALHHATCYGHLEVVKRLVDEKADINARNKYGKTALLIACQRQKLNVAKYLFQANASCNTADTDGNSPLHYLIKMERPCVKLIKLFIKNTTNFLLADYDAILNSSQLKVAILQNVKFCCQVIVNKYINHDLPKLYKLPVAQSLPSIKIMKRVSQEVFQAIERTVRFEIQKKGHYNLLSVCPKVLTLLCVKSVLKYYDKKV